MRQLLTQLEQINWSSLKDVACKTESVLRQIAADRALLARLIDAAINDPSLLLMCEHYDLLDKFVLYRDEKHGLRLRLHVFLPGYFDRPHNHRWSYSSIILRGQYQHSLYGHDDQITDNIEVDRLQPVMVRVENQGSFYTLHHSMIHSVVAEPYTVSLIVRGPSIKERFMVMDRATNQAWWQYGASLETVEEREGKRMSQRQLAMTIAKLRDLELI